MKSRRNDLDDSLMSAFRETKVSVPDIMSRGIGMEQGEKVETRGRKALNQEQLRIKIRDELSRQFIRIEREAFRTFPEKGYQVKQHVQDALRRAVG